MKKPFCAVWAQIHLNNLKHNLRGIRRGLSKGSDVLAIVKAEAYGHGMIPVAKSLHAEGVRFFGVATACEALILRKSLSAVNILVLGATHPSAYLDLAAKKIFPTISNAEDLKYFQLAVRGKKAAFHLKIDTGMGRLGACEKEFAAILHLLKKSPNLCVDGFYTHFSSADHEDISVTLKQIKSFNEYVEKLQNEGIFPKHIHCANSAGFWRLKDAHLNLVRPGISLYGVMPPHSQNPKKLKPVLEWKAKISFIKQMKKGQTVSYGRTHTLLKDTLVAVIPVGYSHGYRIDFSGKASVLVRGRRCRVIGRVTMDQTLIDVGHVPGVKRWDEVVLIGHQGKQKIEVSELAHIAETIPYEILCSIHSRVPRVYALGSVHWGQSRL